MDPEQAEADAERAMALVKEWVQEDTGGVMGSLEHLALDDGAPTHGAAHQASVAWEESTKAALKCERTTPQSIVVSWTLSSDPDAGTLAAETVPWAHVYLDMELPDPSSKQHGDGPAPIMFRPVYTGCARTCALSGLKPGTECVASPPPAPAFVLCTRYCR